MNSTRIASWPEFKQKLKKTSSTALLSLLVALWMQILQMAAVGSYSVQLSAANCANGSRK